MDLLLLGVIAVVAIALLFDFTNGFHDAANSVATVVATRALPVRWAPAFSAVFNFLAYFVVGTAVANTIAKTIKTDGFEPTFVLALVFSALFAAVAWNYFTWHIGMPSSSSHAIIGGLVGAGIAAGGFAAISWESVTKAGIGIIASPLIAFAIAFLAMYIVKLLQRATKLHDNSRWFKGLQLVSAAGVSFGHGANDAQKTMGVIAALLLGAGYTVKDGSNVVVPEWVALSAYGAIALGTLWGGWKIIETMGLKLTLLHANSGLAANIGASTAIFGATALGVPISTTHAAASSIVGAGVSSGRGAHWRVVGRMVIAWVVTIPAAGLVGFTMMWITRIPGVGSWIVGGVVVAAFAVWAVWAMLHTIKAKDVDAEVPDDKELDGTADSFKPHLVETPPAA